MAQDSYIIANGTGAAVRAAINTTFGAVATNNSGASAPSTTYSYQWWADTTNGLLKIRNAANSAWITLGSLSTTHQPFTTEATIASATTTDLGTLSSSVVSITGTTTITSFGSSASTALPIYFIRFTGALTLTHNATSLILPGAANITTAAGDAAIVKYEGSGNWRVVSYRKASGAPVSMKAITNSLSADVNLNNTGSYFDGPSLAQGTSGTWFVSGTVTVVDSSTNGPFLVRLWDGTTTIDSAVSNSAAATSILAISVSGFIISPAGNLRISVRDSATTNGKILFNSSGLGKDSTITAILIG